LGYKAVYVHWREEKKGGQVCMMSDAGGGWGEATEWMATRAEAEEKGKLRRRTKWGSKSRSKKERKLQRRVLRGSSFEERELSFFREIFW
jgi:hypothetical protein